MAPNRYIDFDVLTFLEDYNIEYKESGKNIGRNWYGLKTCIFCGNTGYHLGMNKKSKYTSCFVCGEGTSLFGYIKEKLNISKKKVYAIINKYSSKHQIYEEILCGDEVVLPSNMQTTMPKSAYEYLKGRGFNPFKLRDKYGLKFTKHFSVAEKDGIRQDFSFRIMVPIMYNKKLVAWSGRDYTGQAETKYLHQEKSMCLSVPADSMYNTSSVTDRTIIVEGVTDVWKMGNEVISGQGIKFTKNQLNQIKELNLKQVAILLDFNAEEQARHLGDMLYGVVPDIRICYLEYGDPGDLSYQGAFELKRKLLYG